MTRLFLLALLVPLCATMGCLVKKPVQAMYCVRKTPDGKHCAAWAKHDPLPCVHDVYGDCQK